VSTNTRVSENIKPVVNGLIINSNRETRYTGKNVENINLIRIWIPFEHDHKYCVNPRVDYRVYVYRG
jgi:hypothetical protein